MLNLKSRTSDFRIDVDQKIVKHNDDGTFEAVLTPSARRYRREKRQGVTWLIDRFDGNAFEEKKLMSQLAGSLPGRPIYYQPSEIDDPLEYVRGRRQAIEALLDDASLEVDQGGPGIDELLRCAGQVHRMVVVRFAVGNYAELAQTLQPAQLAGIQRALTHELQQVSLCYRGRCWRSGIDGASFYFLAPSYITKADLALGFSETAACLVLMLNQILSQRRLPTVQWRFAIESGDTKSENFGNRLSLLNADIVGD